MNKIDEELREKLSALLKGKRGIEEKGMFGGAGFTLNGKLLCGVMKDNLLIRIDKEDFDTFIKEDQAKPMVMAGKSGKTYILINKKALSQKATMKKWVDRAIKFVKSLPEK